MSKNTMYNIGCFSFYITWNKTGETGIDHRGHTWIKVNGVPRLTNRKVEEIYTRAAADVTERMNGLNELSATDATYYTQLKTLS